MVPQQLHRIDEPSTDVQGQHPLMCTGCPENRQASHLLSRFYSFEDPVEYVFDNVPQVSIRVTDGPTVIDVPVDSSER